uniref:Protein kinase domain-containing protein n=1 Tax=Chromera velia CCMP2878 TaxID=1169474 RepID=A0A0G4G0G9_9ALVE|eukprot:Cvel_4008.t1-p1 / transcript=Cvel_4008.t1 / gene=Cvel_4008 / organism=Chromera_velia_CCMP2878 / gene_product=Probable serine/threonine-protein kinase, putative / transcript_product=Probable serine/threonine-protein kinase, putative / location=Cvel_scaffold170:82888-87391(-) / protein_length=472 / sequence_SO=supercontig / SO=protein_coding / is_pseudo=false
MEPSVAAQRQESLESVTMEPCVAAKRQQSLESVTMEPSAAAQRQESLESVTMEPSEEEKRKEAIKRMGPPEGWLPVFLQHPFEEFELKDYISDTFSWWSPYNPQTRRGRYLLYKELEKAPKNEGEVKLYRDLCFDSQGTPLNVDEGFHRGRFCAVKRVPLHVVNRFEERKDPEQPLNDPGCARLLSHFLGARHVVTWYDCALDDENVYFISELANKGDLFNFLKAKDMLTENDIRFYMYQVLTGLDCLHSNDLAHLDISVENVILRGDGVCLLIDFGMAWHVKRNGPTLFGQRGKENYMDPAMRTGGPFHAIPADIFSTGVTLLILLTVPRINKPPWYPWTSTDRKTCALFRGFCQHGLKALLNHHGVIQYLSRPVVDIMEQMLNIDPAKRPSAAQLKLHPWFTAAPDARLQALMQADATRHPSPGSAPAAPISFLGQAAEQALAPPRFRCLATAPPLPDGDWGGEWDHMDD